MTSPSRVAVIGDVGGHSDALREELVRLGADPATGALPTDLLIVQVGDLVHRGPDSEGVVSLVDGYLTTQPERWIQLAGNHEAQYLREPTFEWPERIDARSAQTLNNWWGAGLMRCAAALHTAYGDFLVTHAGLTSGFWHAVGQPGSVDDAALAINGLIRAESPALFHAGAMLGFEPTFTAGPLWAAAASELVPSLLAEPLPFSQIHGHTTIYDPAAGVLRGDNAVVARTEIDLLAGHEFTNLSAPGGDVQIVGVDPSHTSVPRESWRAWEAPLRADQPLVW